MAALARADAHPISLQDLYDHFHAGKPLPEHAIVLTFDDCTLGHFTNALPLLKKYRFPAVFFVQTASVGVRTEKEHMDWEQLRQAEATGLITVESHTITHPEDMTKLSDDALTHELQDSRQTLEERMGHPIQFLAYPSGTCDARVSQAAMTAGYLAAVTMDRGWVANPAQSYFLPRLTPKRVQEVIDAWSGNGEIAPPLPRLIAIKNAPLTMGTYKDGDYPVQWIAGGDLATEAVNARETVGKMAKDAGAEAALNGTFFADARVAGTNGAMIGPCLSRLNNAYEKCDGGDDSRIEGRPLVLIGKTQCLVLPYTAHMGQSLDVLQQILPDVQDAFVAGGWILHYGKALTPEQMQLWATADYNDARHRSFVAIDSEHRYVLGATQDSVSTSTLAKMLEQMHMEEAWLLDSGFSTSLIWRNRVLVSGHTQPNVPSRPVPHALFLMGEVDKDAPAPPSDAPPAYGEGAATLADALSADSTRGAQSYYLRHSGGHRHHRRRHRSRVNVDNIQAAPF